MSRSERKTLKYAGGVLPKGGGDYRGDRAGRPGIPLFPAVALKAPAHQQRPRADKPRDKAQVDGGADIPSTASLMRLTGAVMCEQDKVWQELSYFFGGKNERALRRGSHVRDRRDGRLGAAGSGGQEDDRIWPQACGRDRGNIRYQ